ncbi:hypothetical protein niasHT_008392 [Heterodera trifolii]|uniref:Uncharacterized protein n=1 Tax=Heterodera trifolii TaxID=157864 RepID=A0ABD2LT01_9BILA
MFAKIFQLEILFLILRLDYSKANAVTDSCTDVLDRLGKISKGALNVVKLAGPLGQLIHTGISVTLSEDSDELRAIKQLNEKITTKFDELAHKFDVMLNQMEFADIMEFYQDKVTTIIGLFEHQISKFLKSRSESSKEHIEEMCKDIRSSPLRLLMWLHGKVNLRACTLPNEIENKVYIKALALLGKMDDRLVEEAKNEFTKTEYNEWKSNFLYQLTELPYLDAIQHLVKIEKGLSDQGTLNFSLVYTVADLSQQLVQAIGSIVHKGLYLTHSRQKREKPFKCILKSISMAYARLRTPLLEISNMIIADVTKLDFIGTICSGILSKGNTLDFESDMVKYDQLSKGIAESMHSWLKAELDSAWPIIIVGYSIKELGKKAIEESDYERFAAQIRHSANERGNQSFLHQVVVGPAWERGRFFYEECERGECATIINKCGVNVVISRYNNREAGLFDRLKQSREWIEQNRSLIIEYFKKQLDMQGGNANLADITHGISVDSNFNFMVGHNHWRQMVILHNRKWFAQSCVIPVGFSGSKIMGMHAYDNGTEVFMTSSFSVANRYKLFLLI